MRLAELEELSPSKASERSWVFKGDEFKYTSNHSIIAQELDQLREKRIMIEILAKGYKSTPSMLISAKDGLVELDRPLDWPGLEDRLLIQYRFPGYPFSYLVTSFEREAGSSIYCSYPQMLVVNERRRFFRISVPTGCLIIVPKRSCKNIKRGKSKKIPVRFAGSIKDISLGGVCFYMEPKRFPTAPALRARIGPLRLVLKVNNQKLWDELEILEGEVVRSKETSLDNKRMYEVALKFILKASEEKKLYDYVRMREIELAKVFD